MQTISTVCEYGVALFQACIGAGMPRLARAFSDHPASVGETYGQHMGVAFGFGARLIVAGCACLLHGLLPFLFVRTGSATVRALHDEMLMHRRRHAHASAQAESNQGA
jgi:hypothetical protein